MSDDGKNVFALNKIPSNKAKAAGQTAAPVPQPALSALSIA